jgi:cysteinyl-tRNA synthetase
MVRAAERRFDRAAAARQASGMVEAILELEAAIHAWAADTEEDQGTEQARVVLRGLIGRLGRAAQEGLHDPRARLRPAVESLLTLRAALRGQGNYPAADAIRDALTAAGLHLRDTADGPRWSPDAPPDQ